MSLLFTKTKICFVNSFDNVQDCDNDVDIFVDLVYLQNIFDMYCNVVDFFDDIQEFCKCYNRGFFYLACFFIMS